MMKHVRYALIVLMLNSSTVRSHDYQALSIAAALGITGMATWQNVVWPRISGQTAKAALEREKAKRLAAEKEEEQRVKLAAEKYQRDLIVTKKLLIDITERYKVGLSLLEQVRSGQIRWIAPLHFKDIAIAQYGHKDCKFLVYQEALLATVQQLRGIDCAYYAQHPQIVQELQGLIQSLDTLSKEYNKCMVAELENDRSVRRTLHEKEQQLAMQLRESNARVDVHQKLRETAEDIRAIARDTQRRTHNLRADIDADMERRFAEHKRLLIAELAKLSGSVGRVQNQLKDQTQQLTHLDAQSKELKKDVQQGAQQVKEEVQLQTALQKSMQQQQAQQPAQQPRPASQASVYVAAPAPSAPEAAPLRTAVPVQRPPATSPEWKK